MPGTKISAANFRKEVAKRQLGKAYVDRRLQQSLSAATKRTTSKAATKTVAKQTLKKAIPKLVGKAVSKLFTFSPVGVIANAIISFFSDARPAGIDDKEAIERWNREVGASQVYDEEEIFTNPTSSTDGASNADRTVIAVWNNNFVPGQPGNDTPKLTTGRTIRIINILPTKTFDPSINGWVIRLKVYYAEGTVDNVWKIVGTDLSGVDARVIVQVSGGTTQYPITETIGKNTDKVIHLPSVEPSNVVNIPSTVNNSKSKTAPLPTVRPATKPASLPTPDPTKPPAMIPNPTPQKFPPPDMEKERGLIYIPAREVDSTSTTTKKRYKRKTTYLNEDGTLPVISNNPNPTGNTAPNTEAKTSDEQKWDRVTKFAPGSDSFSLKTGTTAPPTSYTPPTSKKVKTIDPDKVESNNPQPDEQKPPFIPPPPTQNPPDKCRGTCAGKNGAKLDKLTGLLTGVNTGQNAGILNIVQDTNNAVRSTAYGLEKIQDFASIAWRTTRAGKVLEYLGLVATLHNAAMLSRNVGTSLGDITSAIANNTISFLTNEESNAIDINETLGNTIENILKNALGEEIYNSTSESFQKSNRIINAASNIIYSFTAVNAGLAQGLETIGNYTGKIGNALKKSGAVLEDSYSWMSEKVSVKTGRIGQVQRIIDGGEQIENFASDIQNATEEFREAQENVTNISEQFNKVKTEIGITEAEIDATNAISKTNSQGASPELTDFVRDPFIEQP
jgi:hypothetical protein